jgi:hypothetical protein
VSITSANSVFMLGILGIFPVPQPLQGYDVDGRLHGPDDQAQEVKMGIDGRLSGGYIPVPTPIEITLQADSASNVLFEEWYAQEQAQQESFTATGLIRLPSIGETYTLAVGFLTGYTPFAAAKKVLQPRKFEITWQSVIGAPIG